MLLVATLARIMIAKTVEDLVPNRVKPLDKHRFTEWYPDIIDQQISTQEIIDLQLMLRSSLYRVRFHLANGFRMLTQALK